MEIDDDVTAAIPWILANHSCLHCLTLRTLAPFSAEVLRRYPARRMCDWHLMADCVEKVDIVILKPSHGRVMDGCSC